MQLKYSEIGRCQCEESVAFIANHSSSATKTSNWDWFSVNNLLNFYIKKLIVWTAVEQMCQLIWDAEVPSNTLSTCQCGICLMSVTFLGTKLIQILDVGWMCQLQSCNDPQFFDRSNPIWFLSMTDYFDLNRLILISLKSLVCQNSDGWTTHFLIT